MKLVHLVAGEASGDAHGAALIEALHARVPDWRFEGLGGPGMREAGGQEIRDWVDEAAVVGLWEVLKRYPYFRREFDGELERIARSRPDAVVFVDYPGFNLRLAHALRQRAGYRGKLIYFISPQVWAWNRGRIPKMAKDLDLMLCIFPFEKALYEASGLKTEYIGHPMLDRLSRESGAGPGRRAGERENGLVGLFPGSREREVSKILPPMIGAARLLREKEPSLRFEVACANRRLEPLVRELCQPLQGVEVRVGEAHDLMRRAWVGAVASGTATLEAGFFGLPYVLVYRVNWFTGLIGRMVVKVDFLGMVNILAGRELVREFVQEKAEAEAIADGIWRLIPEGGDRAALTEGLRQVVADLGEGGAADRAAEAVVRVLG